jgi:hypothetical protein
MAYYVQGAQPQFTSWLGPHCLTVVSLRNYGHMDHESIYSNNKNPLCGLGRNGRVVTMQGGTLRSMTNAQRPPARRRLTGPGQ